MAISDVGTLLYHSATGAANSFSKLIDILDAPATGSAPGKIEVTTLTSTKKAYIKDRLDTPDMEFGYNYIVADYDTVEAVADGTTHYFLIIYQDNSGQKITGQASTWKEAVSKGSAVTAKLHIVPSDSEHQTAVEVAALTLGS